LACTSAPVSGGAEGFGCPTDYPYLCSDGYCWTAPCGSGAQGSSDTSNDDGYDGYGGDAAYDDSVQTWPADGSCAIPRGERGFAQGLALLGAAIASAIRRRRSGAQKGRAS
jgi:hypothetical protein